MNKIVGAPLQQSFYDRPTEIVAEDLLGKLLLKKTSNGWMGGEITETEAYLGLEDPACHSFQGKRTPRTDLFYQPPGMSYIYLIYGMYHCFNIITMNTQTPEAVLVRSIKPLFEIETLRKNRENKKDTLLTTGPGRLCLALNISMTHNRLCLWDSEIQIHKNLEDRPLDIETCHRVGIESTGDAAFWPLRFYQKNSPYVSRVKSNYSL